MYNIYIINCKLYFILNKEGNYMERYYFFYSYFEEFKALILAALPIFLDYLWINVLAGAITAVVLYIMIYEKRHSCLNSIIRNIIITILFIFEVFVIFYFYNLFGIYSICFAFLVVLFAIIDCI